MNGTPPAAARLREAQANPQAWDAAARKRLHDLSLELTGLARAS